jgi:hypothetical protein
MIPLNEEKSQEWQHCKEVNSDPYGSAGVRFAEAWADLMEEEVEKGKTIAEVAEKTSHTADTEGITGFMYGCAVSILADCWIYGEELRVWHNNEYGHAGEGVVNPAIITINTK